MFLTQSCLFFLYRWNVLFFLIIIIILIVVDFVIHWNETAMGLHVFPIPIPPPTLKCPLEFHWE